MGKPDEFDPRLKSYLHRGASTPPPAGMDARIIGSAPRRTSGWVLQVVAAAAVLVLAIGLGIVIQRARQSVGVTPTATPFASPITKPTPYPTPTTSGAPYPLLPPASMHMINASTGWAAGSGTDRILRTTDGGNHWNNVTPSQARLGNWATFFFDANNAWLASSLQPGSPTNDFSVEIYRTSDGGRTWLHVSTAMPGWGFPAAIGFVDRQHGWLFMKQDGTLQTPGSNMVAFYGTTDGGASWNQLSQTDTSGVAGHLPQACSKLNPVFLSVSTGWIPGSCGAGGGYFFYTTTDGGQSWQLGPLLPTNAYSVYFLDAAHAWTLDAKANSLLFSGDGGQHWSTAGTIPSNSNGVVRDFQFVTSTVGGALGADSRGLPILKTSDGGQTWTTQFAP